MDKFMLPEALNLEESNLVDVWRRWKQCFEVFSLASGLSKKGEKVQAVTLLHVLQLAQKCWRFTIHSPGRMGDKNKAKKILEKFEICCIPRKNVMWQRHLFYTCNQSSDKSFDHYLTDHKTKAQSCEFNDCRGYHRLSGTTRDY